MQRGFMQVLFCYFQDRLPEGGLDLKMFKMEAPLLGTSDSDYRIEMETGYFGFYVFTHLKPYLIFNK